MENMKTPDEQNMLIQSFKQLVRATGMEMPMAIEAEVAAVEGGKTMSNELQRMLAEASMSMMNQLRPETMPTEGSVSDSEMSMYKDSLMSNAGMTDAERAIMENEAFNKRIQDQMVLPSQDGKTYSKSSGVSMEPNVMSMQEAIDAGIVSPTRPRARPAAPMTSMRPQARPMR